MSTSAAIEYIWEAADVSRNDANLPDPSYSKDAPR
jgi:hypothetical protein